MWRVVAAAVAVAALARHTSADVLVKKGNQTVTLFEDSPASFGPLISIDGFQVRTYIVLPYNIFFSSVETC